MKVIDLNLGYKPPIIIMLGYFDCLHIGHKAIIDRAILEGRKLNAEPTLLTFKEDIKEILNGNKGQVLTYQERLEKMQLLGVNNVLSLQFNDQLKNTTAIDFLDLLSKKLNIKAVVCGEDYRFGKNKIGNICMLNEYFSLINIPVIITSQVCYNNEKVSTSLIKECLKHGDIGIANKLLYLPYIIKGTVEKGRQMGRKIGFPTINFSLNNSKMPIKEGVYKGIVYLKNKEYKTITNIGKCPTFNYEAIKIESYINDFEGDLYGQEVSLYIHEWLREIKKFESVEALIAQLKSDLKEIR